MNTTISIIIALVFLGLMLIVLPFALRIRSRAKDLEAAQRGKEEQED
jgi:heme/copper-type cytochrome/quinol oxidase subunit 2